MTQPLTVAPPWCVLDFRVDVDALTDDLRAVESWAPQAEASVDQRVRPRATLDWAVVPLRSARGDPNRTDPGLPGENYARTPFLDNLPAFDALLAALPCETMCVRLMRLLPGMRIAAHNDPFFGFDYGKVRLHVPVVTAPPAVMTFGEETVHWSAGRLWYGDFSQIHSVHNGWSEPRVHLVADCVLNDALLDLFPPSHRPSDAMTNRVPLDPAPPAPLAPGRWRLTTTRRAFDWTNGADADLDAALTLDLLVGERPGDVTLTMSSGVPARLSAVAPDVYRVGAMPEETTVRLQDGETEIVRRVGASRTTFTCAVERARE